MTTIPPRASATDAIQMSALAMDLPAAARRAFASPKTFAAGKVHPEDAESRKEAIDELAVRLRLARLRGAWVAVEA